MRVALFYRVSASMHQVGLSQTHTSVQIKWVVGFSGSLGDGERCRVGKLIAGANHKTVEGVF